MPSNGLISFEFPAIYKSLFDLNAQCVLLDELKEGSAFCEIINSHLVILNPNGQLLDPDTTYQLILSNITNPNRNLKKYKFIITTYHSDNIYNQKIIARSEFDSTQISLRNVQSCKSFEVSLTATNAFFEAQYEITLICPSYIKEASELKLYLSWKP